jgi:serine protease Do
MKKICLITFVLAITLNSCVTFFAPRKQTINITTYHPNDSVYVDGKFIGSGKTSLRVNLKKDIQKQLTIKQKGFITKNTVLSKTRKSKVRYLDFFFMLAGFLPGYTGLHLDRDSPKFDIYEKNIKLDSLSKLPTERTNLDKFIIADHIFIDDNSAASKFVYDDNVNHILNKYNYIDTIRSIYTNYSNSISISANISISLSSTRPTFYSAYKYDDYYVTAGVSADWTFKDYYGLEIGKITITKYSDPFVNTYRNDNLSKQEQTNFNFLSKDHLQIAIENALENSINDLLKSKQYAALRKITTIDSVFKTPIIINKPAVPSSLDESGKSVVIVKTKTGHGSGFIISEDGYIVTNYHVVAGNEENIEVILKDGSKFKAEVIRKTLLHDLALLKIDKQNLPYLSLIESGTAEIGSDIVAIGTPKSVELEQTATKGIIAALRKSGKIELIQTDLSVNSGNSGGPLLTSQGEVIGIVTSKIFGFGIEGISFSVPAKYVFENLNIKYK